MARRFASLASFVLGFALVLLPSDARAQSSPPSSAPCFAHLSEAKLISTGTGWAIVAQPADRGTDTADRNTDCTTDHLYWTDDDGKSWREITPPNMPARSIGPVYFPRGAGSPGTVFFLDRLHGWLIASDVQDDDTDARFYLLSTSDGGKTWQRLLMQRPTYKLMDDFFPTQIYFSDPSHGWILWHWAMMNSTGNALLGTVDGGRTWKRLPDPPGAGPMDFTSARDGWMIGASKGQIEAPMIEDDQLWASHDGGEHWSTVSIPVPGRSATNVRFGQLKFNSKGAGVVTARAWVSNYVARFFVCVTHDGGKSWHFSQFDGYEAFPSIVDTRVIWIEFHWSTGPRTFFDDPVIPATIRIGDREIAPVIPDGVSLEGNLSSVDFLDDSSAWAIYLNTRRGVNPVPFELLSTGDGGKTFRTITPPAAADYPMPPPELFLVNGSIARFPPLPPFARIPPAILLNRGPAGRMQTPSSAGGPMMIRGTGFRRENTVWIGSHRVPAESSDGQNLNLLVPSDVAPGTYEVYVENVDGKSDGVQVPIRPQEALKLTNVEDGEAIHAGQQIFLTGEGVLLENEVWFGAQGVPARLVISGGPVLNVTVPASLAPGPCDVYITNAAGKSNVVRVTVE